MNWRWIGAILVRDLRAVQRELNLYADEQDLWATPPGAPNAAGTLALHLAGNLQHYVGARLGASGYVRNREAEFARRDVPRSALLAELDAAIAAVETVLAREAELPDRFPEAVGGWGTDTGDFLVHLVSHLGFHLGQIDYHRRLVTADARSASAVSIGELASAARAV
jgi:hypothetical protein